MYVILEVIFSLLSIGTFYFLCGWLDASQMVAKDWSSVLDLWSSPKVIALMLLGPLFMWYGARNLFKYCDGRFWISILIIVILINIFNLAGRAMVAPAWPSKGEIIGLTMMFTGVIIAAIWK